MAEPAHGLPAETYEYLRERGFGWNKWLGAFRQAPTWRMVRPVEDGWVAKSAREGFASPAFPDPITAFVYAETCGWTAQENTL